MEQTEKAVQFLEQDTLSHIDMLECIRRGTVEWLYAGEHGVLLRDRLSGIYMVSADTMDAARACILHIRERDMVVCHQDFYKQLVKEILGLSVFGQCYQAAYLEKDPLPEKNGPYQILPLEESHLSFVLQNYQMVPDEGYILDRLRSGTMYGVFVGEKPVGFIGMHTEGSLGMLEILPEYRKRGLAFALEAYAINRILEKGWTPFGQIMVGNLASMRLQQKLGLTVSQKTCCWAE